MFAETGAVGPNRRTIPVCLVFFRRSSCFAAGVAATVYRPTQQQISGMNTIILRQVNFFFVDLFQRNLTLDISLLKPSSH